MQCQHFETMNFDYGVPNTIGTLSIVVFMEEVYSVVSEESGFEYREQKLPKFSKSLSDS